MHKHRSSAQDDKAAAAGNGLVDRRSLLSAATGSMVGLVASPAAAKKEIDLEPWMQEPGSAFVGYGQPSSPVMAPVRPADTTSSYADKGFWRRRYL
jgi:hypothetical protein